MQVITCELTIHQQELLNSVRNTSNNSTRFQIVLVKKKNLQCLKINLKTLNLIPHEQVTYTHILTYNLIFPPNLCYRENTTDIIKIFTNLIYFYQHGYYFLFQTTLPSDIQTEHKNIIIHNILFYYLYRLQKYSVEENLFSGDWMDLSHRQLSQSRVRCQKIIE